MYVAKGGFSPSGPLGVFWYRLLSLFHLNALMPDNPIIAMQP